ncbi:MAG: hypothetical protein WCO84_04295, partial [bacterium]
MFKRKIVKLLILCLIFSSLFTQVFAATSAFNKELGYQGKITDNSGVVVSDGTYSIRFRLYTAPAGGVAVFDETSNVVTSGGIFSTLIGQSSSTASLSFNQILYLGVSVQGDSEMLPRKMLASAPSAFEADRLDGLDSSDFLRSTGTSTISVNTADTALTVNQSGTGNVFSAQGNGANFLVVTSAGNVGIGTSSPYSALSVGGEVVASNFTATSTTATSTFQNTLVSNLKIGTISGILRATAGYVTSSLVDLTTETTGVLAVARGGTGTTTAPTYGQTLVGNNSGGYDLVATSTFGLPTFSDLSGNYLSLASWYSTTTDALTEGATNLYYTVNRFASALSATTTDALAQGVVNKYYSNSLFATSLAGTTTDALAQGTINKYYATSLFASDLAATTTDALREGLTNVYYTDARVNTFVNASTTIPKTYTTNVWTAPQIFTYASATALTVTGDTYLGTTTITNLVVTNTGTSTFANLTVTGNSDLGTVSSGTWNGAPIGDAYITKTGNWTGTLDGQEGAYYLVNSFSTTSADYWETQQAIRNGISNWSTSSANYWITTKTTDALTEGATNLYYTVNRFASALSATTTDALAQGVVNKYYSNSLFATSLAGTTTDALAQGTINKYYATSLFASDLAATTTDALREGLTNVYYTDARVNTFVNASTTIPKTYTTNVWTAPQIFTYASATALTVTGDTYLGTTTITNLVVTNTGTSTFANLTVTGNSDLGTVSSGTWNGAPIGDAYITKTGNWTGTLDGQEGAYYLANSFSTTSAAAWYASADRFSTSTNDAWLATKTTDNLTQGAVNKYYATSLFASDLAGTTTDALVQGAVNKYYATSLFARDLSSTTTDALTEGATNLYYTVNRFASALSATTTDALAQGVVNKYYSNSLFATSLAGTTTDALAQGTINKYYATSLFASDLAATTTDALREGLTNVYYTDARVNTFVNASTTIPKTYTTNVWTAPQIFTYASATALTVTGDTYLGTTTITNLVVTNTGTSTFANLTVTGNSDLGTVSSGTWNGAPIGDAYITKTGNWTGTLDGQEGAYYLVNSFSTTSADYWETQQAIRNGISNWSTSSANYWITTKTTDALTEGATNLYYTVNRFASALSATTTDALAQGVVNKYYSNSLFATSL